MLAMKGAENRFAALENLSDEELAELHEECKVRAEMARGHIERRLQVKGPAVPPNGNARTAPHGPSIKVNT